MFQLPSALSLFSLALSLGLMQTHSWPALSLHENREAMESMSVWLLQQQACQMAQLKTEIHSYYNYTLNTTN